MSLARRLYVKRFRQEPAVAAVRQNGPIYQPLDLEWDDEARTTALREAQRMMDYDPEAGQMLLQQLEAELRKAEKEREGESFNLLNQHAYDPLALYEWAAYYYHWSWREIEEMDYGQFFAVCRQGFLRLEREQEAIHNATRRRPKVVDAQATGMSVAAQPHRWEGETVPYGR